MNTTVVPHPHYISLFPRLKIKLKGWHLDTIEVIEAQSQTTAISRNTTSKTHFKWQNRWERCIRVDGVYFEGDDGQ
jgi:hypothetical protein